MAQTVKNLSTMRETWGMIPGSGRSPGEKNGWLPTAVFLPEEFHGQRSLMGYGPSGHKVWDTTDATSSKDLS